MEWLNYHHLLYFWTVAREGTVARASLQLGLAQPTISGQIRALENALGEKLFVRSGRKLALTGTGTIAFRYADEIFGLGRELMATLKNRPTGLPARLRVGVADILPKAVAYRLLEPALNLPDPVQVVCREDGLEYLLADLALHRIDVVLSDAPADAGMNVRAFSHLLGECGMRFYGTARLASAHRRGFPGSLNGAPVLLPTLKTSLRRSLDQWFDAKGIHPQTAGEFDDFALLRTFAERGAGIFAAPTILQSELRRQGFQPVHRFEPVRGRFYAISVERRLKHPAVVAICSAARETLFA